jgi:hypothetical protein
MNMEIRVNRGFGEICVFGEMYGITENADCSEVREGNGLMGVLEKGEIEKN